MISVISLLFREKIGKIIKRCFFLFFIFLSICPAAAQDVFYLLASTQECGDLSYEKISGSFLKKRGTNSTIHWSCRDCEPETKIALKYTYSNKSGILVDTLNILPVKCITPDTSFLLDKYISFKEMRIDKKLLSSSVLTLTFGQDGKAKTLFVGVSPSSEEEIPAPPIITHKSGKDVFFCRGELHSFEASLPDGVKEEDAFYRWYIDGVEMTGRQDRWFETYSRTNWEDGEHIVACNVRIGKNGIASPLAKYSVVQLPGTDCHFSIKAIPYWGAECGNDVSASEFRYNEKSGWGSFQITPMEEYVHFYLEVINKKITSSSITNNEKITDFKLIPKSEADNEYYFFVMPVNMKVQAKEPYIPHTVYFKIEGTNINFSTLPYISPKVSISPDSVFICENAFMNDSLQVHLSAKVTGFEHSFYSCYWYYSENKEGNYQPVNNTGKEYISPLKTGYYRVLVSDGVYDVWSDPAIVLKKTDDQCISVYIENKERLDYACKDTKLKLTVNLKGDDFHYQWKKGKTDGTNLEDIQGAINPEFEAPVSVSGEAWFVEVEKMGERVLSQPFIVREIPALPANSELTVVAKPDAVCPGHSVTLIANLKSKFIVSEKDSSGFIYDWYKINEEENIKIDSIKSLKNTVFTTDILKSTSEYFAVVTGCNGALRSLKNIKASIVEDDKLCSSGVFYVKQTGNDWNNGLSWKTAYASVDRALRAVAEFRNVKENVDIPVIIHIAAGNYFPSDKAIDVAYHLPENITIYGGYVSEPVDGTSSAIFRNPLSPANSEGNATVLKTRTSTQRIFFAKNVRNVKISGIRMDGESLMKKSILTGRVLYMENAEVIIDSCWITGFYSDHSVNSPLTTIFLADIDGEKITNNLTVRNTTFSANRGGQIGACIGILSAGKVDVWNSTFTNNTTQYYGGVAILSYNASPEVNLYNSTFYDNTCTQGIGYYGRSVLRMVGGNPIFNIYSCTITDRFYKEDGVLNIFNSIVECAGKADIYQNNFPVIAPFKEDESKNKKVDNFLFLSNFKGETMRKLQNKGALTQVLVPSNKIEIVGKAGSPCPFTLFDQNGIERNKIASSFGACDADYSVAIFAKSVSCPEQETKASFLSSVAGLSDVSYQWINNYSDITDSVRNSLENVGIGTYWLEVKGMDKNKNLVSVSSNEIRISDICVEPGVYYVKTPQNGGDDNYSGNTWNQSFATIERALQAIIEYRKEAGKNIPAHIYVAAGTYYPDATIENLCKKLSAVVISGGYPANAVNGDTWKDILEEGASETILNLKSTEKKDLKQYDVQTENIVLKIK